MAVDKKYLQGPGGFYDSTDGSGPYAIDSAGDAILMGGAGGGEGGTSNGLTNAQLRATPVVTTPKLASGGNLRVSVTTGSVALAAQACSQVTIINRMDTDIVVTIGGNELDIMSRSYFTFFGITNLSALSIKGSEAGNISLRWEV